MPRRKSDKPKSPSAILMLNRGQPVDWQVEFVAASGAKPLALKTKQAPLPQIGDLVEAGGVTGTASWIYENDHRASDVTATYLVQCKLIET